MQRRKIAVLGGGCGSLFAVWDLVHADPKAYDITVYQVGWRLGGKGASGIDVDATDGSHRIEEHGLHFMFGFYENVFRVVRQAHEECYGDPNVWRSFFTTEDTAVSMIHFPNPDKPSWQSWDLPYPEDRLKAQSPGMGGSDELSMGLVVKNLWAWASRILENEINKRGNDADPLRRPVREFIRLGPDPKPGVPPRSWSQASAAEVRAAIRVSVEKDGQRLAGPDSLMEQTDYAALATALVDAMEREDTRSEEDQKLHDALAEGMEAELVRVLSTSSGDGARIASPGLIALVKFMRVVTTGIFKDLLWRRQNWWDLDGISFNRWVERHGGKATDTVTRGLVEAVFATNKEISAGALLQAWMRALLLFKGGAMFKMTAGMGDTIFAPIYRVLKETYGVKFKFFHRVEDIVPSTTGAHQIDEILFERQVDGADDYRPLFGTKVEIGGQPLWCWPNRPLFERLPPAEAKRLQDEKADLENDWTPVRPERQFSIRRRGSAPVEREDDFDDVILGISVAAIPSIASKLLAKDAPFSKHVNTLLLGTTATQAMQIWFADGRAPKTPGAKPNPIVVPYLTPYDTVAKMSHLGAAENFPTGTVGGVYYLCSALLEEQPPPPRSATSYPDALLARATDNGAKWLKERATILWPDLKAAPPGAGLDITALYDRDDGTTFEDRYAAQWVVTPRNLSDRYVIPVPGSFAARLKSNDTIFLNLYLAGDWIKNSLSIGCLESAAMGGLQCARALSLETDNRVVKRAYGDWIEDVKKRPRALPANINRADVVDPQDRPRLVQRDNETIMSPPYIVTCDDLFMFYLRADRSALQALCDRELNLGPTTYRPLGDFVILYGANMGNKILGTSLNTNEMGIWVPVIGSDDEICVYSRMSGSTAPAPPSSAVPFSVTRSRTRTSRSRAQASRSSCRPGVRSSSAVRARRASRCRKARSFASPPPPLPAPPPRGSVRRAARTGRSS